MSKALFRTLIATSTTLIAYTYARQRGIDTVPTTAIGSVAGALLSEYLFEINKSKNEPKTSSSKT